MSDLDTSKPTGAPDDAVLTARLWADLIAERELTLEERKHFEKWLQNADHDMELMAALEIPFRLAEVPEREREWLRSRAIPITPPRYLPARFPWARPTMAAAAAAMVLLVVGVAWRVLSRHPHYSTGVGATLATTLADGTRVELNSKTDLEWLGGRCDRRVRLTRGEALFEVHNDSRCPFEVIVGRGAIEVLGTRFDIYQHRNGDEEVSVLEGRVRIHGLVTAASTPWYLDLNAGQRVIWGEGVPSIGQLDASKVTAWREARLEFDNQPLPEVVEELQRYTPIPIQIADPRLLTIHVTGEVQVDPSHIRGSVLRLAERPEIEVHDNGRTLTLTYRAQDSQTSKTKGIP